MPMPDGTVRGCVWGAASTLLHYEDPAFGELCEAIEQTYQTLNRDGAVPMLPRSRGIDHRELARIHDVGFVGQQMAIGGA